jgi:Sec-independent protein translocase protein TatA
MFGLGWLEVGLIVLAAIFVCGPKKPRPLANL